MRKQYVFFESELDQMRSLLDELKDLVSNKLASDEYKNERMLFLLDVLEKKITE